MTFIKELGSEAILGEYAFFSGKKRKVSAKCTNVTTVMALYLNDFMEGINCDDYRNMHLNEIFDDMKREINETNSVECLGVSCYRCEKVGHYAVDCPRFDEIKGKMAEFF